MNGGERYKLSDMSRGKSVFASASHSKSKDGSEENILPGNIMISVTYGVQADTRLEGQIVNTSKGFARFGLYLGRIFHASWRVTVKGERCV